MEDASGATRLLFLDNVRYLAVVLVVALHSVSAYAVVAPHWPIHDTQILAAALVREFLDVFLMPVLFFAAGYFALPSFTKHGPRGFLWDKVQRLLVPWALAVFVVLPLALYDQPVKPVRPFWRYWLNYMSSFQVRLRPGETPVGITTQAVYWFISLLFVFFLVFALAQLLRPRLRSGAGLHAETTASDRSVLTGLIAFAAAVFVSYFALLLVVPDSSWFTLHMFLEFQVTRLLPFALSFALGIYAQSHGWFAARRPAAWPIVSAMSSVVLAAAYLWFGQPVFADTSGIARFSVGYLLGFSLVRSLLLLSLLAAVVFSAAMYWNRSSRLDRGLASSSYDMYLVHFFVVLALQAALLKWVGGAAVVKIAVVFTAAVAISAAISRWVIARHARAFTVAILALFGLCLVIRP